ncbi:MULTISPECIES: reductase [Holzapfeliella]
MLIKYKNDYEKIAMGFLSYLDDLKSVENLKEEMKLYQSKSEFVLYLYKEKTNDFIGVLGVQEGAGFVMVRYVSLSPNYRYTPYINDMLSELQYTYPKDLIIGTPENAKLIQNFEESRSKHDE